MSKLTHRCPGGCGEQVPYGQLACRPDWFRLPKPLRDEISDAYRRRSTDARRHLAAVRTAMDWYVDYPRTRPAEPAN